MPMRKVKIVVGCLVALLIAALCVVTAQDSTEPQGSYSMESVKAAFLYRFLEYVEWPAATPTEEPFTIAVLGDDSLTAELRRNVRGRQAHGREIRVRSVKTVQEGVDAQVFFVSAESKRKLGALGRTQQRDPVLIVTEGEGALDSGSVINFVVVDGNVRFEVSLPAAEQRGLKLSSRLLNVALRVEKSGHRLDETTSETNEPYVVNR
jgi:YfiR/HmsC-like